MNPEQESPEAKQEAQLAQAKHTLEDKITWSDELPEEFIQGQNQMGYHKYKYRTNWFQGVFSNLRFIAKIKKDEVLMQEIQKAMTAYAKRHIDPTVRTIREEIDAADALIKKALTLLERK